MTRIRRGNYVFMSWIGDHDNHVHIFRDGRLVLKWDLDNDCEEEGFQAAGRKLKDLIRELEKEGLLGYGRKNKIRNTE